MTYTFKLSRRLACLRAAVFTTTALSFIACNSTDTLDPNAGSPIGTAEPALAVSSSQSAGIPMGLFALPNNEFTGPYNGGERYIYPEYLLSNLAAIRARGGRVALDFGGNERNYKSGGRFSLSMWKARIDKYRAIDFSSYVNDGTIIGHYLIDEPYDPYNWGVPLTGAQIEEMAKYSKQIWPNMPTIVRAEPYKIGTGPFKYLDAAWAQYAAYKGPISDYTSKNVSEAQRQGLALIVGLAVSSGGMNGSRMSPSQVQSWGTTMLGSSYPCAFISWQYTPDGTYSGAMRDAMGVLRGKAENRGSKTCRNSSAAPAPTPAPPPPPPPPPPPVPVPTPTPVPPPTPGAGSATLPFGLSYAPIEEYSPRWTGTVYQADPAYIVGRLDRARGAGMKVIVALVGATRSKNADGTFSLTKWKAQVDRFRGVSLGQYVSAKTFYLHDLVDQPDCASCWGGKAIPWETVEEMARYSKSIWPTLPTVALVAPSKLAAATFRWTYLDAGWMQYVTTQGDLRTTLAREVGQARSEGLGLVVGLNLQHAAGGGSAPMTASQVKSFGAILASEPAACAFAGYRHDSSYMSQSGIRAALDAVAAMAGRRNAASCVVN